MTDPRSVFRPSSGALIPFNVPGLSFSLAGGRAPPLSANYALPRFFFRSFVDLHFFPLPPLPVQPLLCPPMGAFLSSLYGLPSLFPAPLVSSAILRRQTLLAFHFSSTSSQGARHRGIPELKDAYYFVLNPIFFFFSDAGEYRSFSFQPPAFI